MRVLTQADFGEPFAEFLAAHGKPSNAEMEKIWYREFKPKDPGTFKQVMRGLAKFEKWPNLGAALAFYRVVEKSRRKTSSAIAGTLQKVSCAWCEGGRIFYTKIVNKKPYEFFAGCALCLPGPGSINPREHEKIATRPIEAGGPITINPDHLIRNKIARRGDNPDKLIPAAEAKQLFHDAAEYFKKQKQKAGFNRPSQAQGGIV